jgi:hypothetical protein
MWVGSPDVDSNTRSGGATGRETPNEARPGRSPEQDPLAAIAVPLAPIVLEGRYRLLVAALWRLGRSRRGQWVLAAGSGAFVVALALLAARHFATTSWPPASGDPGLLAAAGVAVSVGALGIFAGGAIFLFAVAWRTGLRWRQFRPPLDRKDAVPRQPAESSVASEIARSRSSRFAAANRGSL